MLFKKSAAVLVGTMILLSGCAKKSEYMLMQTKKSTTEHATSLTNRSIEYRILPQDRLEITLYKDPTQGSEAGSSGMGESMNSKGILVNTAGNVSLPLIGKVKVAGLTQTQAADRITERYRTYLNTPSVYLEVLNKRLFVLGEVKKPGVVNIDKEKMTLFEALANAGDLTDDAVRNEIMILSNSPVKGMQIRTVDLTNFDTMNYASLMLRPNDIVYVKPDSWKRFKVASDNYTAPLETITRLAAPFVTLKYLAD
ncbi:polysaccharide biosynthesis/export family protein [Sulfurovum sp.]|uniref:polysaccharide biosynthesis/export family protein n=1 Tax=Sulfurovum sp. TaxID=1969726 RepID=UPI002867FFEF|nr:polysaccharide biosynthesis/export family protein [Sulfurovum sp.]